MENFEKKYEEYKKNFYDNIDKENIEKEKEKLKEEIYDLIYKSIGYLDIDGIILESRKDAIDYKDINHEKLYEKLSIYNDRMVELNNKIIKIHKIEIIKKDNVLNLSKKYINFISLYANRENIKKFNKLFEIEKIDDNFYLLNIINKIDINKIEFIENITPFSLKNGTVKTI